VCTAPTVADWPGSLYIHVVAQGGSAINDVEAVTTLDPFPVMHEHVLKAGVLLGIEFEADLLDERCFLTVPQVFVY